VPSLRAPSDQLETETAILQWPKVACGALGGRGHVAAFDLAAQGPALGRLIDLLLVVEDQSRMPGTSGEMETKIGLVPAANALGMAVSSPVVELIVNPVMFAVPSLAV
jgi:hypothetical protein